MSILEAVALYKGDWKPKFRGLPAICKTERKRMEIEERLQDITAATLGIDLYKLREKLIIANTRNQWAIIEARDWKFTSECLSMGEQPLIRDEQFVKTYLAALQQ